MENPNPKSRWRSKKNKLDADQTELNSEVDSRVLWAAHAFS